MKRSVLGLAHCRVQQDYPNSMPRWIQNSTMLLSPAEGDRAAPIVRHGDHRARNAHYVSEGAKICHPFSQSPSDPGALGEAHVELVDSNDAYISRCLTQELPPQIGPGRIAVHAEQGQAGPPLKFKGIRVENMPGA